MSTVEKPKFTKKQYRELAELFRIRLTPYIPHVPHPTQHAFLWLDCLEALFGGAAGGGKAIAHVTPIATLSGWTTIGDLKPGDFVFGADGKPTEVLACSEIMLGHPCFELTFDDNTSIVCDAEHVWLTQTVEERMANTRRTASFRARRRAGRPSRAKQRLIEDIPYGYCKCGCGKKTNLVKGSNARLELVRGEPRSYLHGHAPAGPVLKALTTKRNISKARETRKSQVLLKPTLGTLRETREIAASVRHSELRVNHSITSAEPLQLSRAELPVDPYVLGAWLGDGSTSSGRICLYEQEMIDQLVACGCDITDREQYGSFTVRGLRANLKELRVLGNKCIPLRYLRASYEQRAALLQGMMDTDGSCSEKGQCSYTTVVPVLARDFRDLLVTLGIKATVSKNRSYLDGVRKRDRYRFKFTTSIPPFRLARKLERWKRHQDWRGTQDRRYIVSCEKVHSVPVRCIKVAAEDGMFLAGRQMIPTHNSDALLMAALMYVDIPGYNAILFRKTYADLNLPGSLIPRSHEWLNNSDAKWNENDSRWTFPSGATLSFGYMRNDEDRFRYQCFAPGTEILTEYGWQAVQDVEIGTLAATLDPKTREMLYEPVIDTQQYDYDGNLVEVYGARGVAFSVTPEHKIWHTTHKCPELTWRHAEALPATAHIPQWANWSGGIVPGHKEFITPGANGKTVQMDSRTWASFLGWYLAEGSLTRSGIQLSQHTEPGISIIKKVMGKIEGHWRFDEDQGRFLLHSKTLRSYLSHLGLSLYKYVPADVMDWDREHLQLLLDSLVEGDGTWRNNGESGHFVSSSKQLADDVCEIGFKCGYRPTICERTEVTNYSGGRLATRWHVSLIRKSTDTELPKDWKSHCLVPYQGPVYCVTVPPHHTVLIRYRGRVSWSGQSAEFLFCGMDEVTHLSKLQYTYMFSRLRRPMDLSRRNPLSQVPLRMRAASNPGGRGHYWVKQRFIKPMGKREDEPDDPRQRIFIPSKLEDNPSVDAQAYKMALAQLDEATQQQLIHGDWEAREPGPWVIPDPTWIDAAVAKGIELWEAGGIPQDPSKPKVLCIDWGEFTQAYLLWPMPNGGIYVLPSEVVGEHEDPASVGLRMLRRAEMIGIYPSVVRYDSAGIQSMRTFASTARAREGWERLKTQKIAFGKYKKETMNYLRLLFKRVAADRPDRIIAIHPENQVLIRQLRGWVRKDDETEDVEKFDDHGPDAIIAGVAPVAAAHRAYIEAMIQKAKEARKTT